MRRKSSQFSRVAMALGSSFLIVCWLMGAPRLGTHVRAQAQTCAPGQTTLTVMSGNGAVGGLDSLVQVSTDGGTTFQSATIVSRFILDPYSWAIPIAGSQWLSINSDRGGNTFQNMDITYRTTFTLPAAFSSPTLAVQVHSDNVATMFLNGNQFGMQPDVVPNGDIANFQDPPESFTTTTFFQPGTNELSFRVHNYTDSTGLDFRADICYSPAQGCVDQSPPSVSCSVHEDQLWPANHDLENVGLSATITDDCDCFRDDQPDGDDDDDDDHHGSSSSSATSNGGSNGNKAAAGNSNHHGGGDDDDDDDGGHCTHPPTGSHSVQVLVYSDEPDLDVPGSGNFSPDAKNIALGTLRLRSERSGNGDGRVYLVVVKATDASGKVGYCAKTVTVTHDQSNASKNSVAAQANAARTYFMTHHVPPPSFVQVGIGPPVGPKQ